MLDHPVPFALQVDASQRMSNRAVAVLRGDPGVTGTVWFSQVRLSLTLSQLLVTISMELTFFGAVREGETSMKEKLMGVCEIAKPMAVIDSNFRYW